MGSVKDFVWLYLWLVWIKRKGRQVESKITNTNIFTNLPTIESYWTESPFLHRPSSYKKLLERAAFWIVYIAWRVGYKVVAYNTTSVGVAWRNRLFLCVCVAETVLLLILINIVYIAVVVACQNGQLNGPVNVNMIFQALCNILSFLSSFATQSFAQTHV